MSGEDGGPASDACVLPRGHEGRCMHGGSLAAELLNVAAAGPEGLWPGDTLSHRTARECVRLGWARRDEEGRLVLSDRGHRLLKEAAPGAPW